MPEKSDDQRTETSPSKSAAKKPESGAAQETSPAAGFSGGTRPAEKPSAAAAKPAGSKALTGRKKQYMIAPGQRPAGQASPAASLFGPAAAAFQPFSMDLLEDSLKRSGDVEVVDRIAPPTVIAASFDNTGGLHDVLVANMPEAKASAMKVGGGAQIVVEENRPLSYQEPGPPQLRTLDQIGVAVPGPGFSVAITVVGNNAPIEGAQVYLIGSIFPAQGTTDANGRVLLNMPGESPESVRALYVKPQVDYWNFYLPQPSIDPQGENVVTLTPLSDSFRNFPTQEVMGWGQRAMRLDQVPPSFRGAGVKIAIIDSGAAVTHQDLNAVVRSGFDVVNKSNQGWETDTVFHGTHCAGVIAGSANNQGIRGFAPDAEVLACKIFPGGMFSSLLSALDFCMDQNVDVVNLSLGSGEKSEIVEQRINKAKQMGIACIVAAGNSGGPVQYPATSPNVLAVAAIGRIGEFPADSYHTQTVVDSGGEYFSAKFTCNGPEIGVCAPGVAIRSSVPPNNFAAWDGTSMAAPHVTGLAALILAHHDDFRGAFRARNAARVERLFEIIRSSCVPVGITDRTRVGAGMPDAVRALRLQPSAQQPQQSVPMRQMPQQMMPGAMPGVGSPQMPVNLSQLRDRLQQVGILASGGPTVAGPQPPPVQASPAAGFAPQSAGPQFMPPPPAQQFASGFQQPPQQAAAQQTVQSTRGALDRLKASMQESKLL